MKPVWIVDDDRSIRWVIEKALSREGGSGLGLTLAQAFIAQHEGSIECESIPGCTVFTVLLPLESQASANA